MSGTGDDQVLKWASTSGAALELRVAAAFRRRLGDRSVDHGLHYPATSSTSGMREVDVVARAWTARPLTDGTPDIAVTAVVECKSYKRAPWVLFESDEPLVRQGHEYLEHLLQGWTDGSAELAEVDTLGLRLLGPLGEPHAYHLAAAAEQRDENRNVAWDAVRQLLDAADAARWQERPPDDPKLAIYVPIIVVSAPLFALKVDTSGELVSRSVGMMPMLAASTISPEPTFPMAFNGRDQPRDVFQSALWIVNEQHLNELVEAVYKAAKEVRLPRTA